MKKRFIRVAISQINTTVGDLHGNRKKLLPHIKSAKERAVDIVIFPELTLCGYPPEDLLFKEHFVRDNLKALRAAVKACGGITAIVGFVDRDNSGNTYNAAAVIRNTKIDGIYHKASLPNYGVFDEKRYFSPGDKNRVFNACGVKFGVTICEDIWEKDGPHKRQADLGAKILINISASPYHAGKGGFRQRLLSRRAKDTGAFVVYNNLVGGQDGLVFDGHSLIVNPEGRVIASGPQFKEALVIADLDLRRKPGAERRAEEEGLAAVKAGRLTLYDEVYSALVLGTRDYVRKNGFKKAVIGLSGGIDSALTAAIACDAIGRENVIGISMPSQFSSRATQSDAEALAKNLRIQFNIVPIKAIFEAYIRSLSGDFKGLKPDISEENLQARIRGNILMAFSNKFGWLVLTTGNKSETSTGYCTLYGDMAGGFAVLKDVPKTLVYKLADFRNRKKGRDTIPGSILSREPSAELRHRQKDRDTLPPYPLLDTILKHYIEEDMSFEKIASRVGRPRLVKKVIAMVDRNEYKRRQSPPGIRITPKAFDKDRRLPITNRYR